MEGSQPLLIKVKRKRESLLALIEHFPTRHDLLDGVPVGAHGIIHLLHRGQYDIVELVDGLIELCPLQAFFLQVPPATEYTPRHRRGNAPRHTSPLAHVLEAKSLLTSGYAIDAVSVCVDDALSLLYAFLGKRVTNEVADEVFRRFCVGK